MNMADLLSVREFNQGLRKFKPGQSLIVVDGVRKKIIASFNVVEPPEEVTKVIRKIYSR